MRFCILLFLLFLTPIYPQIHKYSPEEFPLLTYEHHNSVVLFFQHNDTLSDYFLPTYERIADFITKAGYDLAFVQVNMSEPGEKPFDDLTFYPNLRIFLEGKPYREYIGMYNEKDFIYFLESLFYKPPVLYINEDNENEFNELLSKNEVLIAYFGENSGKDSEVFNEIALSSKQHTYVFVSSHSLIENYLNSDNRNDVIIFRQCGSNKTIEKTQFNSMIETEPLSDFITKYSIACLNLFNEILAQRIFGEESDPFMILFLDIKSSPKYLEVLSDFAHQKHEEMLITYCETFSGLGHRMGKLVGITKKELPMAFIIASGDEDLIKYPLNLNEDDFTVANLETLYNRWKNKQMVGFMRSGYFPNQLVDVLVPHINAKDFNERVIFDDIDVVVIFEKPGCKVCQQVTKILEKFILKNIGKLRGYRLDYLDDELHEFKIGSFPSIYFFGKKDKMNPQYFIEDKVEEKMFNFFRKNLNGNDGYIENDFEEEIEPEVEDYQHSDL